MHNSYSFIAYGHPNISARHKNTFEFTKDKEVTKAGDCIIGVNADFELESIRKFIKNKEKIRIIIKVDGISDEIDCKVNKEFNDNNEIVVRRSEFSSERTLGIRSEKACIDLNKELVEKLKHGETKISITLV